MERIMQLITFNDVELHLQEHSQYEFLLSNKEVALGYGITENAIIKHLERRSDELIEGKHWLRLEVQTKGGKQKVIHWTKKGIVRLGFFIKSKQAKKFRDWAEDYIVHHTTQQSNDTYIYQLERENIELRRAINRLSINPIHNEKIKELQYENTMLKKVLINFSNRYHSIVLQSDNKIEAIKDELTKMTNRFQLLPNIANDGKNLNTETMAQHSYWFNQKEKQ